MKATYDVWVDGVVVVTVKLVLLLEESTLKSLRLFWSWTEGTKSTKGCWSNNWKEVWVFVAVWDWLLLNWNSGLTPVVKFLVVTVVTAGVT